jgi:hypothetical protein
MRFRGLISGACLIFAVGLPPMAGAQARQSLAATAPALRMGRYDKSAEVVTSGTILSIQTQKSGTLPRGTYIVLHSGALTLSIHMGLFSPGTIPFGSGDQVQVTGSLISLNGGKILLARQVQSASQTLTVRSTNGFVVRPHAAGRMQGLQQ